MEHTWKNIMYYYLQSKDSALDSSVPCVLRKVPEVYDSSSLNCTMVLDNLPYAYSEYLLF